MAKKMTPDFSFLVDFTFWQSWLDHTGQPSMSIGELEKISRAMAPLIEDALNYYLTNGKAPTIQEDCE